MVGSGMEKNVCASVNVDGRIKESHGSSGE